jgi:tetratricopeptide (TPR) repeat protein
MHQDVNLQSDMLSTLGNVYDRIGDFNRAEQILSRVVSQTALDNGDRSQEHVESLIALDLLRKDQGRMQDAEDELRLALRFSDQGAILSTVTRERAVWALGTVLSLQGDYGRSKELLSSAVAIARRERRTQKSQFVLDLEGLADDEFYHGNYKNAEPLYQQALSLDLGINGDRHPSVSQIYNGLGNIKFNRNDLTGAISDLGKSLSIDEAWYGPAHPEVAADLSALSQPLISLRRYDEAREDLERALAILKQAYGENHSQVASAYNSLGLLAYRRNQEELAKRYFEHALAIWTVVYGNNHPFIGLTYANLASVAMDRRQYQVAATLLRKALQVYSISAPSEGYNAAVAHIRLGRVLLRTAHYEDALPETLEGLHFFGSLGGANNQYREGAEGDLKLILAHLGDSALAQQARQEMAQSPLAPTQ